MQPTPPIVEPVDHDQRRLFTAILPPLTGVGLMWLVFAVEHLFELELARFGIHPRVGSGLLGVVSAPFIHGGLEHLVNNSTALLVLGWLLVYFYPRAAWRVVLASAVLGGAWVWLAGRTSYHIGASGVVYGMAAFLFFSGLVRRQVALMTVSLIVVFLYGSMWWGVLPLVPGVSWESHLFGGVVGAVMAWVYRKVPPAHVPPPIELEDDPDEEELPPLDDDLDGDSPRPVMPPPSADPLPGPWPYDPGRTSGTW